MEEKTPSRKVKRKDRSLSTLILGFMLIVGVGLLAMISMSVFEAHQYSQQLSLALQSFQDISNNIGQ